MINVEYHEYDCGSPCTPDGCMGHTTDIPVGIEIDGVWLWVDGYWGGDYPGDGKKIADVQKVINKLIELDKKAENGTQK